MPEHCLLQLFLFVDLITFILLGHSGLQSNSKDWDHVLLTSPLLLVEYLFDVGIWWRTFGPCFWSPLDEQNTPKESDPKQFAKMFAPCIVSVPFILSDETKVLNQAWGLLMCLVLFWCSVEEEENEEAQEEAPKDEAEIQVGAPGGGSKSFAALRYRLVGVITLMCFGVDAGDVYLLGF
jgi:hypothetical protein